MNVMQEIFEALLYRFYSHWRNGHCTIVEFAVVRSRVAEEASTTAELVKNILTPYRERTKKMTGEGASVEEFTEIDLK